MLTNINQADTQALFTAVGQYTLKLTASDGQLSTSATVNVTVNPAPPGNQAPVVSAGPNQTILLPANTVTLNGSAQDDGLPAGSVLGVAWSEVSGPALVSFSAPSAAITTATFTSAGTYVLQLAANDSQFTSTSNVTIVVSAGPVSGSGVTVQIVSPADGAVITTRTPVIANISGGSWTLEYALNGDDDLFNRTYTTIASGLGAVNNAPIATFDPTLLLNGMYVIRLTSVDA